MNRKMKCPFQTGESGEFLDCHGESCMAYCEYTPICLGEEPPTLSMCKLLQANISTAPHTPVPLNPTPINFTYHNKSCHCERSDKDGADNHR